MHATNISTQIYRRKVGSFRSHIYRIQNTLAHKHINSWQFWIMFLWDLKHKSQNTLGHSKFCLYLASTLNSKTYLSIKWVGKNTAVWSISYQTKHFIMIISNLSCSTFICHCNLAFCSLFCIHVTESDEHLYFVFS
jgi:hypothetical protein